MVGQWLGKARRMAGEFQSQFQEAMREADVAEMKKQFDDVSQAASNMATGNLLTSTVKDVEDALKLDTSSIGTPTTPEPPTAETQKEATLHEAETAPHTPSYPPVDKAS
jgi:sec-independent protein translocase protein TatB